MKIYALSDPHLSSMVAKPMDIFGNQWQDHAQKICTRWEAVVRPEDLVLVPGDISWAMRLPEALPDLEMLDRLPGQKLLTKGNHDYWWPNKKRDFVLPGLGSLHFLHGKAIRIGRLGIAATRAWSIPGDTYFTPEDQKIYDKELRFLQEALEGLGDATHRLCMLHFPPFNDRREAGGFVPLLERFGIQHLIHGHLHGPQPSAGVVTGLFRGITYHLTSCDLIDFTPVFIADVDI